MSVVFVMILLRLGLYVVRADYPSVNVLACLMVSLVLC
ncbi:hypothetical protein SACC_14740 [Saccharolobus caldissimus]|uniref:Uncharacterized protein n=1 Tax=Saccharolobus caldissimus TaxID=1702097 RepID=A0AAQ4CNM4_9CREN|nr:hypothetical protein SACC_04220 [Saccharolobus caldissimus]BDB98129.1 hypothetical protein SACC_11460 [Saccharolobus caldissimus]BDB98457.1 hypothetical protein SACC_14740 [Saccharolobus caldissimus]